jgi:hypothetical protein
MMRYCCTVVLAMSLAGLGCSPLKKGDLFRLKVKSGEKITYAALIPADAIDGEGLRVILALPSGFEEAADVVNDVNNVWRFLPDSGRVGVVVPSAHSGGLLSRTKYAGFAFGAEVYIEDVIRDVEQRYGLSKTEWVVVDIGGNGRRLSRVLRVASTRIWRGYLVPSFSVDEQAVNDLMGLSGRATVIIGDRKTTPKEIRLSERNGRRLSFRRTNIPPLSEATEADIRSVWRDYASMIVEDVCSASVPGQTIQTSASAHRNSSE